MNKTLIAVKYSDNGNSSWADLNDVVKPLLDAKDKQHAQELKTILDANKGMATELKRTKVELEKYLTMRWNNAYNVVKNAEGYITDINPLDTVVDTSSLPEDIEAGYWHVVNGKLKLDEIRKAAMLTII